MSMIKYVAALLIGVCIGLLFQPDVPSYEGAWEVQHVRTVPNDGRKPELVQRIPRIDTCVDRFPRLPALAKRLNVPTTRLEDSTAVIEMCDGRAYDIFDILNALLDKMERK